MKLRERYFNCARSAATMSDYKRVHIGCVAVQNNKILSIGFNTDKTHPMQKKYNKYRCFENGNDNAAHKLHAEVSCLYPIHDLDINWSKVSLYIYRVCKSRPHGNARPCPACMQMIKELGIRHIFYTSDDGLVYENINKEHYNDLELNN